MKDVIKNLQGFFADHYEVDRKAWEHQYAKGHWEALRGLPEVGRYAVIIGYCRFFKPDASILDVGCGEGVLLERLKNAGYVHYVGIDISQNAIARAKGKDHLYAEFHCSTAEAYVPARKFDIIVFNEVLYYLKDPCAVVDALSRHLASNGIIIISWFDKNKKNVTFWKRLFAHSALLDRTQVRNGQGHSWTITVVRPR